MCRTGLSGCPKRARASWPTQFPSWRSCPRSVPPPVRPTANDAPHDFFNLSRPSQPGLCFAFLLGRSFWRRADWGFFFSSAGSMTILPTALFLITGVLRETALRSADNSVPLPVSAALQAIKTIITSPLAQVDSIQTQWASLVRSSLASVLEHSEPGEHTHSHTHKQTKLTLAAFTLPLELRKT